MVHPTEKLLSPTSAPPRLEAVLGQWCPTAAVGGITVSCSFQLTNQAIDSNQDSESEMHPHRRNKHKDSHLDAHSLCCQQKNNRAGETSERSSHANNNLWCRIVGILDSWLREAEASYARGTIIRRVLREGAEWLYEAKLDGTAHY
jgi:hypothetical protein